MLVQNEGSVSQDACSKECKVKINNLIYLYVVFISVVGISDILNVIIKLDYLPSVVVSIMLIIMLNLFYLKKNVYLYKFNFNKLDILVVLVILLIAFLRIGIPDSSFDTVNYHLYLQSELGKDNIFESFFPSRIVNTHTWPLADRMFYIFRYALGYRMGTILNTLVVIMLYLQVKNMLKKLIKIKDNSYQEFKLTMFSLIVLFIDHTMWLMGTYCIDLLVLPLMIEVIATILFEERQNSKELIYIALISGIIISVKVSNALIILFIDLIYFIKFKDDFKIKYILVAVIAGILPSSLYMGINFWQTGNPVFPFANSIFKSPYFVIGQSVNDFNGVNGMFGVKKAIEFFIWPIIMFISPERTTDLATYSGRLTICFIIILVNIIYILKAKEEVAMRRLAFICIYIYSISCYDGWIY